MNTELSGSEAVFGFVAWLTTRDTEVVFGAKHDASVACDLVAKFCETNKLKKPSENYHHQLIHPPA